MALTAFMSLTGKKQGQIKGSVTQKGRENTIAVHSVSHSVTSPRDAASGLATGKRQHGPLTILKENDQSSPLLWQALVTNETITSLELKFYSPSLKAASGTGLEVQSYTINLTNASISTIRESMLDNQNPDNTKYPLREEVSFTYQKIQWTWTDGGITASDDWQAPIV